MMADKNNILDRAQKTLHRYICNVRPLSLMEKEELKRRIKTAIQENAMKR